MQPQHISSQEVGIKISEAQRSSVSFLSHHAVTLFCYSLMWKIVGGMKYWCDPMCLILHFAVRVQVLSGSISQKYTWGKVLDLREVRLISCRKGKIFLFIIEHLITVHGLYYSILHKQEFDICSSLFSPLCFFSLSCILLPPRLASITMWEAGSPLTVLSM